jgi:hypothetical protein
MNRFLLIAFATMFLISCEKDNSNSENHLPKATFITNPSIAGVNQQILFDASAVTDNEDPSDALQVCWSFIEDESFTPFSTSKTATHSYDQVGVYFPRLVVRDTYPLTDTTTAMVVIVYDVNNKPPDIATIITPPNFEDYMKPTVIFGWKTKGDPEDDSLSFDIWVGRSIPSMAIIKSGIVDYYYDSNHFKNYYDTISGFQNDQSYYWKVAAKDPNGNYVFSETQIFYTEPAN